MKAGMGPEKWLSWTSMERSEGRPRRMSTLMVPERPSLSRRSPWTEPWRQMMLGQGEFLLQGGEGADRDQPGSGSGSGRTKEAFSRMRASASGDGWSASDRGERSSRKMDIRGPAIFFLCIGILLCCCKLHAWRICED